MAKRDFWFDGGRLSLDFVGSTGVRHGDLLPAPAALAAWLTAAGLTKRPPALTAAQLRDAHALRAGLDRLLRASLSQGTFTRSDLRLTNAAASHPPPLRSIGLRGADLVAEEGAPNLEQCLGIIARDAIDLLTGPDRSLLRKCAAENCSGMYVDLSRGARRKWCTTAGCGNRTRVSAYRDRLKTRSPMTVTRP